jgi:hypothetical protein
MRAIKLNRFKLLQQLLSTLHFGPTSRVGKPFFALSFVPKGHCLNPMSGLSCLT